MPSKSPEDTVRKDIEDYDSMKSAVNKATTMSESTAASEDEVTNASDDKQDELVYDDICEDHPWQGKLVRVEKGKHSGLTSRVKTVRERGWLQLDHPTAPGEQVSVSSGLCHFLDKLTAEEMEAYYKKAGKPTILTASMKAHIRNSGKESKKRSAADLDEQETSHSEADESDHTERGATSQATNTDIYSHSGVRSKHLSDAAQESFSASDPRHQVINQQCDQPDMLNYGSFGRSQRIPRPLPPVLLEASDPNRLPPALRRLDPDTRIDIFNRKTGKVMSGPDAVRISDLPQELMAHSEYEPIVPTGLAVDLASSSLRKSGGPSSPRRKTESREGRSAPRVRVSKSVAPQLRQSKNKGAKVMVTKGPYRGYIGEVDSRTQGGWYILSHVQRANDKLEFPLVLGPEHIKDVSGRRNDEKASAKDSNASGDKNTEDSMEEAAETSRSPIESDLDDNAKETEAPSTAESNEKASAMELDAKEKEAPWTNASNEKASAMELDGQHARSNAAQRQVVQTINEATTEDSHEYSTVAKDNGAIEPKDSTMTAKGDETGKEEQSTMPKEGANKDESQPVEL